MKVIEELNKKLDSQYISTRTGGGNRSLSYIEGHHAIREANRIFGHLNWDRATKDLTIVQSEQIEKTSNGKTTTNWYVSYTATVVVNVKAEGGYVRRTGIGFGQGIDRDLGQAHESAIKEAETDAMKRALMTFGDPFGLALYDKKQTNVGTTDEIEASSVGVTVDKSIEKAFYNKVKAEGVSPSKALEIAKELGYSHIDGDDAKAIVAQLKAVTA